MLRSSLRAKILLSASAAIIATSATVALVATHFYLGLHTQTLQSRSLAVAHSLTIQLERLSGLGLAIDNIVGFDEQCEEAVRAYPGMHYTQVVRPDGLILFDSRSGIAGKQLDTRAVLDALLPQPVTLATPVDDDYLVIEPIYGSSGQHEASVVVAFPAHLVNDQILGLLLQGGAIGAAIGVLGLGLLYAALRRQVIRPIGDLIRAMAYLRENPGSYAVRVPVRSADEMGLLADGFNRLVSSVEEREHALIEARNTSDRANRMKSDFLAAMSHDLRTPMHAILSMNELLRATPLNEKQQRYSLNVAKAGQWLLGIINDILTSAKIDSGRLDLASMRFDVRTLVADTLTLQEDFAHSKQLELSWQVTDDVGETLLGDAPRLQQMLTNLLSNAIKFTEHGSIRVEVSRVAQHVCFSVTDTGIGIDSDKLSLLFEPFVQVAAADAHRRSGTGLGLAIVKQLAEAMGGEVGVDSARDHGATFWFSARLRAVPGKSTVAEARADAA